MWMEPPGEPRPSAVTAPFGHPPGVLPPGWGHSPEGRRPAPCSLLEVTGQWERHKLQESEDKLERMGA